MQRQPGAQMNQQINVDGPEPSWDAFAPMAVRANRAYDGLRWRPSFDNIRSRAALAWQGPRLPGVMAGILFVAGILMMTFAVASALVYNGPLSYTRAGHVAADE